MNLQEKSANATFARWQPRLASLGGAGGIVR